MDVEPEVSFVDEHGNLLAPPGASGEASSTDPSIRQDVRTSEGRSLTISVPQGAARVTIFLPQDSQ